MQTRFQWMLIHPAAIVAQGVGSGLLHPASGTWGTLVGWLVFVFLNQSLGAYVWAWPLLLAVTFPVGVWACHVTGKELGVHDDSSIVFDEMWAIWLVLLFVMPAPLWQQAIAFGLFRLFDIWKPYPIRLVDEKWTNGLGVMLDDVMAAFYALLVFAVGKQAYIWMAS
ncbi:phosphatidylglycerophosphatase A family protein [Hydromonas duriensis]|nr:phosphatidylglycerophosphatase A [Hydromonas duriensis]